MSVAKVTEIIASSEQSFDDAIKAGVERANQTIKNIQGAWVKDQQVCVTDGTVAKYKVTLKLTFVIND